MSLFLWAFALQVCLLVNRRLILIWNNIGR